MVAVAGRRFALYAEIPKLLLIAVSYLPILLTGGAGSSYPGGWPTLATGVYLMGALAVRNLLLPARLPAGLGTLWLFADAAIWLLGLKLCGGSGYGFPAFILMAEVAMAGWPFWRGLLHSVLIGAGLLGAIYWLLPELRMHLLFTVLIPGVASVLVLYMLGRMAAERAEVVRAHQAAELANVQLREYARQVEELAVLRERTRLAREVHDTVAHGFTGIIMQLEAVSRLLHKDPERAGAKLGLVQEQARQILGEVRRAVHALRPLQLDGQPGPTALNRLVTEFATTTGARADLTVQGAAVPLPAAHELCLYRAAQEGLTNAFRHGQAPSVKVRLTYAAEQVDLTVADDGWGTGPDKAGVGILGIRERAASLGGTVNAGPAPAGGFVLQVRLPLTDPAGGAR